MWRSLFLFALLVLVSLPARAQHSVSLRWNASSPASCPTSGAALSYTVYRVSAYGGSWQAIATGLTSLNYVDSTVQSGSAYYYAAAAVCTCSGTSCPNGSGGYYVGSSESQEFADPSLWAYALIPSGPSAYPSENLSTSDTIARAVAYRRYPSESLSTSDGVGFGSAFTVSLGDSLSTSDAASIGRGSSFTVWTSPSLFYGP